MQDCSRIIGDASTPYQSPVIVELTDLYGGTRPLRTAHRVRCVVGWWAGARRLAGPTLRDSRPPNEVPRADHPPPLPQPGGLSDVPRGRRRPEPARELVGAVASAAHCLGGKLGRAARRAM